MSVLVVGLSHRTASVPLLERVALGTEAVPKALAALRECPSVDEAVLLSTCNRVEVYAEVSRFHGGVQEVSALLAETSGVALDDLAGHLYVHYEDRAVQHLFSVACGLESMVVGESQILGQLRAAYRIASGAGGTGRVLDPLLQAALRVGKRAHAETAIDEVGASVVSVAVGLAAARLGSLAGRHALVVGAGSMGGLAAATLRRAGVGRLTVANRGPDGARRLAGAHDGAAVPFDRLAEAVADADVIVSSTGATGVVLPAAVVSAAIAGRDGRQLVVLDLALPRDVDQAVRGLPGVTLVDMETLQATLATEAVAADVDQVRRIVTEEVGEFLAWQRSTQVAPTVLALRAQAEQVVEAELRRLAGRVPQLDPRAWGEVSLAVRRVVDKLLHAPSVRVRQLAEEPGGQSYAEALRELFGLDPAAPAAVTRAAVGVEDET